MKKLFLLGGIALLLVAGAGTPCHSASEQNELLGNKFYGIVVSRPKGSIGHWNIKGKTVEVTKETTLVEKVGKAEPGAFVEVISRKSGNAVRALRIEVKLAKKN